MGSKSVFVASCFLALLFVTAPFRHVDADRIPAEIQSIHVVEGSDTDFVISGNQNFQFYMYALKNPDRLVIDCRPARLNYSLSGTLNEAHPVVKKIRAERSQGDVALIVFDLKQKAKYSALMTGTNLRVRITSPTTNQVATAAPPPAVVQGAKRGNDASQEIPSTAPVSDQIVSDDSVELSVSTEGKQASSSKTQKNKADAKKPKVNMKGYVVDHFERKVVGSKGREPSTGSSYGMNVRYRKKNKANTAKLKVDYNIAGNEYAEPFADDYMSQDIKVGYEMKLGPNWTLKNVGRVGLYEYGNEYGFRPELSYQINDRSSFSFFAGHRTKTTSYDDRRDQNRFFGTEYKYRFGKQTLELEYQRSFNNSEKDRYDFVRTKYSIGYNVPWSKTAKTTFRLDYSPREFQSRLIPWVLEADPDFGTLRYDQGLAFTVTSRIVLSKHLDLVPKYVFQNSNSNDPTIEDFSLHVSSIALRGRW